MIPPFYSSVGGVLQQVIVSKYMSTISLIPNKVIVSLPLASRLGTIAELLARLLHT